MAIPAPSAGSSVLDRLCGRTDGGPPPAMLVLAHPDDETVGAASLLRRLKLATLAYVTDGAPRDLRDAHAAGCDTRDGYARLRHRELLSAMVTAGLHRERLEFLECVDQEASLHLATIARWLELLMREHAPVVVLTHPYEGGHPDHDAVAFAVNAACRRIAATGDTPPIVAEFTSYHASPVGGWEFGAFLPDGEMPGVVRRLTPEERAFKRRLIECHASQFGVLSPIPLTSECFRLAPAYDFTRPPAAAPSLLYESFGWGLTGAAWRQRAAAAGAELGIAADAAAPDPVPVLT